MENLTTSPEQHKSNQVSNETAKSQQPKKTWIEPELVSMGVDSGWEHGPESGTRGTYAY